MLLPFGLEPDVTAAAAEAHWTLSVTEGFPSAMIICSWVLFCLCFGNLLSAFYFFSVASHGFHQAPSLGYVTTEQTLPTLSI